MYEYIYHDENRVRKVLLHSIYIHICIYMCTYIHPYIHMYIYKCVLVYSGHEQLVYIYIYIYAFSMANRVISDSTFRPSLSCFSIVYLP